ncbi:CMGC protein kinase [Emergomyces africanus]|uniref:CMGC protein kinase n=1 Tax=Emergomyces africanus TaxID=1955775 RepID=A0A1B7P2G2_9EURO|nr:CMGC protein kinase [Emergomyces africanus]
MAWTTSFLRQSLIPTKMNPLSHCMRRGVGKTPRCLRLTSSSSSPFRGVALSQLRNIKATRPMSSSSSMTPLAPRSYPTSGFEVLDHSEPIEEETLPGYQAEIYYPAHIGRFLTTDIKLSASWAMVLLLQEPDDPGYVSLKIYVSGYTRGNEPAVYKHINSIAAKTKHSGHEHIRKFISSFEVQGPHAKHTCIVQQALGITMDHLFPHLKNKSLTLEHAKPFLRQLLFALDFLHTQAGIIHTVLDLQPKNLLLPVSNLFYYKEFEDGEFNDPSYRKIYKDRTIYGSRSMSQSLEGLALICDFGDARFGDQEHDDLIMPEPYRSPEVLMQMKWSYPVDIWSFGMVVSLSKTRSITFRHGRDPETKEYHEEYLIAELGAVLGPPPPELMRRSKVCPIFWDENGNWKNVLPMPDITLETLAAENIKGADDKEKEGFLRLMRRILCWLPEERPSAKDLFFDPWLLEGLGLTDEQVEHLKEHWIEEDEEEQGEEESFKENKPS